jgi:ATP-dependent Clp protease adapter protein ClpS
MDAATAVKNAAHRRGAGVCVMRAHATSAVAKAVGITPHSKHDYAAVSGS